MRAPAPDVESWSEHPKSSDPVSQEEAGRKQVAPSTTARKKRWKDILTGEWVVDLTTARQRRLIHYWLTIIWLTVGLALWIVLSQALWFVGLMSLYAIWITHMAGWAAETPVENEADGEDQDAATNSYRDSV